MEDEYYCAFEAPKKTGTTHIIWNVLLCDKTVVLDDKHLEYEKVKHIFCILPKASDAPEFVGLRPHTVLEYGDDHNPAIGPDLIQKYKECGDLIDRLAKETPRGNVLIFCNSGYQRSIPFICYYLTTFHKDEVPDFDAALQRVLPSVMGKIGPAELLKQKEEYLRLIVPLFPIVV